jgi:hypothetical protein
VLIKESKYLNTQSSYIIPARRCVNALNRYVISFDDYLKLACIPEYNTLISYNEFQLSTFEVRGY